MALNQPDHDLRALLLPWDMRAATMTASTSAAPRPGIPVPASSSSLSVSMSGVPSKGEKWIAATSRAGVPEPVGGTFRVSQAVGEDWRDWDPPTSISGFEFIDRSTTTGKWSKPHAARLLDGRPIVVAVKDSEEVWCWYQSAEGVWSSVSIEDTGAATCACVDVLPSGVVLCWYVRQVATSTCQVRLARSDDSGATWTIVSARCLQVPIIAGSSDIQRLRCKWVNGGAVMLAWSSAGSNDSWWQWGSSDGGRTFYEVAADQSATRGAPDIAVRNGEIYIAWVERDTALTNSTLVPKVYRIVSPGTNFTTVEPVTAVDTSEVWEWGVYSGGRLTSAELAMMIDDDGVIYLYGVDFDATSAREVRVSWSYDGGATWDGPISQPEAVWSGLDTSTYPYDLAVVAERSRGVLFHRFAANPGNADDSLCATYLGGWTTRALPWLVAYPYDRGVTGWDVTWLPFDEPDNTGTTWARNPTGSPTSTLGVNGLTISQGSGDTLNYTAAPATGSGDGYGIMATVELPAITSGTGHIDVEISNATNGYRVRVSWAVSGLSLVVTLRDREANVDLDSDSITLASGVEVLLIVQHPTADWTTNSGHVRCAYRSTSGSSGPSPDKQWTNLTGSTTLQSGAITSNLITVGCLSGTAAMTFSRIQYSQGSSILDDTVARDGFPTRGRTWCPPTSPAYVGRYGHRISAVGGPSDVGEVWTAEAAYDYPVAALDPFAHPSPSRKWRSTSTSQTDITWSGVDKGLIAGDLVGVYIQGANFATCALYADTSASTKIADIDLKMATGLGFTRTRGVIYPTGSAGTAATMFFPENALAGCWWQFSVGGTARKIKGNTAGSFGGSGSAATSYQRVRIELEEWDGADSASGTGGILWSDRVFVVTDIATSTDTLMLRIGSQVAGDGAAYFEAGVATVGRVWLMGAQYSWGRTVEVDSGIELTETPGGQRRMSRPRLPRRAVEFAWIDGLDTSDIYGTSPPDYMTLGYTSAPPAAVRRADLPTAIHGLLASAVPEAPVVYVPQIVQSATAPTATAPWRVVDPTRLLYGWIETVTHRIDTVIGNEFADPGEVVRMGTMRIGEER